MDKHEGAIVELTEEELELVAGGSGYISGGSSRTDQSDGSGSGMGAGS